MAGATKTVTPAGFFGYGCGRETKFPATFFARLSFKKACQPALPEAEAEEDAPLPEAELSASSLASWMAAIS